MRQLVQQQQVLGTEAISAEAAAQFSGDVIDIRGFLSEGRMTYRLLKTEQDRIAQRGVSRFPSVESVLDDIDAFLEAHGQVA